MITIQKLFNRPLSGRENLYTGNPGRRIIKNRVPLESNTTENYFDLIYPFLPNGFIILIRPTSRVRARFNIAKA